MNRKARFLTALASIGLLAAIASAPASAVSLTWNDADFTVGYTATADPLVWRFTYTADFTGFDLTATRTHITGINFKVEGSDPTAVSLISAPGDDSHWNALIDSNLNASALGCGAPSGNNGFVCSGINISGGGADNEFSTAGNAIYTWVLDVTFNSALTLAMLQNVDNPIRAQFLTDQGGYVQMSENGPFEDCCREDVPEPGTLTLLGLGLLGLGIGRRRRTH